MADEGAFAVGWGGESGTDNVGQPVRYWQTLWYALGSFLLGKHDTPNNAYFQFAGNGPTYSSLSWQDEYSMIALGKALGPYKVTAIGGVNVYSREFERGFVYVNPSDRALGSVSVALPPACTCRRRTHDNLYATASLLRS